MMTVGILSINFAYIKRVAISVLLALCLNLCSETSFEDYTLFKEEFGYKSLLTIIITFTGCCTYNVTNPYGYQFDYSYVFCRFYFNYNISNSS